MTLDEDGVRGSLCITIAANAVIGHQAQNKDQYEGGFAIERR